MSVNQTINQTLNQAVNTIIESFVDAVSAKYKIDRSELFSLLDIKQEKTRSKTESSFLKEKSESSSSPADLQKLTVSQLKDLLKAKGLKMTGTKDQLVARYLDGKNETLSTKPTVQSVVTKTKVSEQVKVPTLQIRKNAHGNFEHMESGLIFNSDKKVVGRQLGNGSVEELNEEIVNLCNKYKFEYEIPESFENETEEDEVKEMEEEEIEEEEELVDEEEEELVDEEDDE